MSEIDKQMASLVSPRPTDNLANICHTRNTSAPNVRSGQLLHVALRSTREAAGRIRGRRGPAGELLPVG